MAFAVLTVEADGNIYFPNFIRRVAHGDDGFVPSNHCTLSFFDWTFRISLVADLEILIDHPRDLSSREKAFLFLCCFFFTEDSSLEVSVDDLLEATRFFFESRKSKFVCNFAMVIVLDVLSSAIDFADSISQIQILPSIGRLAPEETPLLKFIRQIQNFPNFGHACFEFIVFCFFFL